ncbi:class I adenylate-forming enzyme family protein [Amycolatopsis pigmentata]|uniref:Class I adenylate-forming enzyme family protein n=1 Tax=Amycolatopsis pigmentata TaxID=450801 RepID=A0ABW5FVU0_9PSEU
MEKPFPRPLLEALATHPDLPAFELAARVVTRGELLMTIARYAGALRANGLHQNSEVAIATGVTPEGFAVQISAHVLGCRVVPVGPGLTPDQAARVAGTADVLVVDETRAPIADAPKTLRLSELSGEPGSLEPQGRPDDIAVVAYTSGSTAMPKGVEYTYAAMSAYWAWRTDEWTEDTRRLAERYRRFLLFGTLASAVMREHLAFCLLGGGTAVVPETPPVFPRVLEELRISAVLLTVPRLCRILDALRKKPADLRRLRSALVAGSPLPPHRLREAFDLIGDAVHQGYGQTETGMLTLLTADDVAAHPEAISSVGRPWTGVELEVRDNSGKRLPEGATGEIWVRTANAFRGYRGEDAKPLKHAGWVRTQDLGKVDAHGFLHLTGRSRDVVIINAIVHYAGAIEQALAEDPAVDEAYVVGTPDERTGEAAHAFVVTSNGGTPDLDALRAAVREKLGDAAVPSTITVIGSVPVAASGKPDKRALLSLVDLHRRATG